MSEKELYFCKKCKKNINVEDYSDVAKYVLKQTKVCKECMKRECETMESVDNCPCVRNNPNHPYEGFMTKHECALKRKLNGICEYETTNGCLLFKYMQKDEELRDFIQNWIE